MIGIVGAVVAALGVAAGVSLSQTGAGIDWLGILADKEALEALKEL